MQYGICRFIGGQRSGDSGELQAGSLYDIDAHQFNISTS